MTLSVESETRGVRWVLKMSDIGEGQGCPFVTTVCTKKAKILSSNAASDAKNPKLNASHTIQMRIYTHIYLYTHIRIPIHTYVSLRF